MGKPKESAVLEVKADGTLVPMSRKREREWRKSIKTKIRNAVSAAEAKKGNG